MNRKKGRRPVATALSRITDFPLDSLCDVPVFTLRGREEAEIAGCRGVLEYDETRVVVKTCGETFTVSGNGLILSDFHNDVLRVRGCIDAVCLKSERS